MQDISTRKSKQPHAWSKSSKDKRTYLFYVLFHNMQILNINNILLSLINTVLNIEKASQKGYLTL